MTKKFASRWIFRTLLIIVMTLMAYLSMLPKYDFTAWVPTQSLNTLGIPLGLSWWLNDKADKVAHFFGGFILTVLLLYSKLEVPRSYIRNNRTITYLLALISLTVITELAQLQIGRKFSFEDILAGVLGGVIALGIHNVTSRLSLSRQLL